MRDTGRLRQMALEQDQRIAEVIKREQRRLWNFIRRRVADPRDVEDILQGLSVFVVTPLLSEAETRRRLLL